MPNQVHLKALSCIFQAAYPCYLLGLDSVQLDVCKQMDEKGMWSVVTPGFLQGESNRSMPMLLSSRLLKGLLVLIITGFWYDDRFEVEPCLIRGSSFYQCWCFPSNVTSGVVTTKGIEVIPIIVLF